MRLVLVVMVTAALFAVDAPVGRPQSLGDAAAGERRRRGITVAQADEGTRSQIAVALSALAARHDTSWINFSGNGEERAFSVSRTTSGDLSLLLRLRVLDTATRERAVALFARWGVAPKRQKTLEHESDSSEEFISMNCGKDIGLATAAAMGLLRDVYLLPPGFRLTVDLRCMTKDDRPAMNCK
jgi:hypothetical protein